MAARFLVAALALGYIGSKLRNPGDKFEVSDEEFSDAWMERATGAAAAIPVPAPPPIVPPTGGAVAIPADWRTIHYYKRIAIAKAISGMDDVSAEMAVTIIEAEANARDDVARGVIKAPAAVTLTAEQVEAAADAADAEAGDTDEDE